MLSKAWLILTIVFFVELCISIAVSLGLPVDGFANFTSYVTQFVPMIAFYNRAMPFSEIAGFILAIMWISFPFKLLLLLVSPFNEHFVGVKKREYWREHSKGTTWGLFVGVAKEQMRNPGEEWSTGRSSMLGMAAILSIFAFGIWFLGPTDLPEIHPTSPMKGAVSAWLVVSFMTFSPVLFWLIHAAFIFLTMNMLGLSCAYMFVFITGEGEE